MAAINTGKVVVAGLAAGLVMNVIDFVSNMFIFGDRMKADLDAINPQLWENMNQSSTIAAFVTVDFILGILLVWLYAAIRTRFGPGFNTAVKAAIFFWVFGMVIWFSVTVMLGMTMSNLALGGVVYLINVLASAWVGGRLYSEPA